MTDTSSPPSFIPETPTTYATVPSGNAPSPPAFIPNTPTPSAPAPTPAAPAPTATSDPLNRPWDYQRAQADALKQQQTDQLTQNVQNATKDLPKFIPSAPPPFIPSSSSFSAPAPSNQPSTARGLGTNPYWKGDQRPLLSDTELASGGRAPFIPSPPPAQPDVEPLKTKLPVVTGVHGPVPLNMERAITDEEVAHEEFQKRIEQVPGINSDRSENDQVAQAEQAITQTKAGAFKGNADSDSTYYKNLLHGNQLYENILRSRGDPAYIDPKQAAQVQKQATESVGPIQAGLEAGAAAATTTQRNILNRLFPGGEYDYSGYEKMLANQAQSHPITSTIGGFAGAPVDPVQAATLLALGPEAEGVGQLVQSGLSRLGIAAPLARGISGYVASGTSNAIAANLSQQANQIVSGKDVTGRSLGETAGDFATGAAFHAIGEILRAGGSAYDQFWNNVYGAREAEPAPQSYSSASEALDRRQLGLPTSGAITNDDIKRGFYASAKQTHPDAFPNATPEEKAALQNNFVASVNAADRLRQKYPAAANPAPAETPVSQPTPQAEPTAKTAPESPVATPKAETSPPPAKVEPPAEPHPLEAPAARILAQNPGIDVNTAIHLARELQNTPEAAVKPTEAPTAIVPPEAKGEPPAFIPNPKAADIKTVAPAPTAEITPKTLVVPEKTALSNQKTPIKENVPAQITPTPKPAQSPSAPDETTGRAGAAGSTPSKEAQPITTQTPIDTHVQWQDPKTGETQYGQLTRNNKGSVGVLPDKAPNLDASNRISLLPKNVSIYQPPAFKLGDSAIDSSYRGSNPDRDGKIVKANGDGTYEVQYPGTGRASASVRGERLRPSESPGESDVTPKTGQPFSAQLYRGEGPNGESTVAGTSGAKFYSPDQNLAKSYGGNGGKVLSKTVDLKNPLVADNWMQAKKSLGLPVSANMDELTKSAADSGHDGLVFNNHNGKQEVVELPKAEEPPRFIPDVTPKTKDANTTSGEENYPGESADRTKIDSNRKRLAAVQSQSDALPDSIDKMQPGNQRSDAIDKQGRLEDSLRVMKKNLDSQMSDYFSKGGLEPDHVPIEPEAQNQRESAESRANTDKDQMKLLKGDPLKIAQDNLADKNSAYLKAREAYQNREIPEAVFARSLKAVNKAQDVVDKLQPEEAGIGQTGLGNAPPGPIQVGSIGGPSPLIDSIRLNIARGLGAARHMRERFAPIEANYGSDIAKDFIKAAAAPTPESNTIVSSFAKRAFGDSPDPQKAFSDWTDLGRYYRLRDLKARAAANGQNPDDVGQGLPQLPLSEVARLEADPTIQKATALYNKEIAPLLNDIRTRNGMIMNSGASDPKKFPFFVNLPGENEGPRGTDTSVNPSLAFNQAATGNAQLKMDPKESLVAAVRGHIASDYKQQLVKTIKSGYTVPQSSIVPDGNKWMAKVNGRTQEVVPVDLAPSSAFKPDINYVPAPIADQYQNIRQDPGDYNTIVDKAMRGLTSATLLGAGPAHALRVVAHTAARLSQSGKNGLLGSAPGWLGSNIAATRRMISMSGSPLGETMQLLLDRSGADKGAGYGIHEPTTTVGKILNAPHDLLFNPQYGVDPMARRVIADAHMRTLLGNPAMDQVESDLNAGKMSPSEAANILEHKMNDAEFVGLGRKVNSTLGFANKQSRSEGLNWASRIFPFVSSESGMIPREVAKMANIDVPSTVRAAQRGQWGQAAKGIAGSLATGAVGAYLAANLFNYLNTKAQTGKGRFLPENDAGHRLDVWIAPDTYLSNLDPTFSRGARLTGLKALANGDKPVASAVTENLNEIPQAMPRAMQAAFTAATALAGHASEPRLVPDEKTGGWALAKAPDLGTSSIPLLGRTASALSTGSPVGPAIAKDAANDLLGSQLTNVSPYQEAQEIKSETDGYGSNPPNNEALYARKEREGPFFGKGIPESLVAFRNLKDSDRDKYRETVANKIIRSKTLSDEAKYNILKKYGVQE